MALTRFQQGALAVAIGSAFWGLFWIPLRHLEQAGLPSLIAVALVLSIAGISALFVCIHSKSLQELKNPTAWIVGTTMGLATVLYFYGVMTSDVIRVIFLFYLLPVWTTIAAKIIYGEKISVPQVIVIATAMAGLWLLLGGDTQIPMPNNAGDWCGLAAGICWGTSLALLKGKSWASPSVNCLCTFFSGSLIALLAHALFFTHETGDIHTLLAIVSNPLILTTTILFGALIVLPSVMGQIWGAGILPAPTTALLTMTEIIVATLSAFLIIGTELTGASAVGALIILLAVLADIAVKRRSSSAV